MVTIELIRSPDLSEEAINARLCRVYSLILSITEEMETADREDVAINLASQSAASDALTQEPEAQREYST